MEQKEINYRIAMSMLMQCALMWEMCTECKNKGEFLLKDVLKLMETVAERCAYKKCVEVDINYCDDTHVNVLYKKLALIPGVSNYNILEHMMHLFVCTSDTDPKQGFSCSYIIESVFVNCYQFCRQTGQQALMKKVVFGKDTDGMWARLPEWKLPKATKKPSVKKIAKPAALAPKISIREAVMAAAKILSEQRKTA